MSDTGHGSTFRFERLRGSVNYRIWSVRFSAWLAKEGLASTIVESHDDLSATLQAQFKVSPPKRRTRASTEEASTAEADTEQLLEEELYQLEQNESRALAHLKLACEDGPLLQVLHLTNTYDMWQALRDLYDQKGFSSIFLLCRNIFRSSVTNPDTASVENYVNTMRKAIVDLQTKGLTIPDEVLVSLVLANLPNRYEAFVTYYTQSQRDASSIELDQVFASLIDESKRFKQRTDTALHTTGKGRHTCKHCSRPHQDDECWDTFPAKAPEWYRLKKGTNQKKPSGAKQSSSTEQLL